MDGPHPTAAASIHWKRGHHLVYRIATLDDAARKVRPRRGVPVLAAVAIGVGALLVGGLGGFGAGIAGATITASGSAATPAAATSSDADGTLDTSLPTDEPSSAFEYTADMFSMTLKVTAKQCFGSAGCNVSVEPVLSADTTTIPDDASGTLTYEIRGDESGPITVTTDLNGTQYSQQQSDLSTSSGSKKITVKITDVETD